MGQLVVHIIQLRLVDSNYERRESETRIIRPAVKPYQIALGQIHQVRGDLAAACSLYARAWAADTTFLPGLEFLATTTYLRGDVPAAEAYAREMLRRAGSRARESRRCGFILGHLAERRELGWPVWGSAARAQGDLALSAGNARAAQIRYQEALESDPDDLAAILELARLAMMAGDTAAVALWRERLSESPAAIRRLEEMQPRSR